MCRTVHKIAETCLDKPRSLLWDWKAVIVEDICVMLGILMLKGDI